MRETRRDRNLAAESLRTYGRAEVFMQHLDGYTTLVSQVASEEDGRHTALSQLALYVITITESSLQLFEQLIQIEYPFGAGAKGYNRALSLASSYDTQNHEMLNAEF